MEVMSKESEVKRIERSRRLGEKDVRMIGMLGGKGGT